MSVMRTVSSRHMNVLVRWFEPILLMRGNNGPHFGSWSKWASKLTAERFRLMEKLEQGQHQYGNLCGAEPKRGRSRSGSRRCRDWAKSPLQSLALC